MRFAEIRRLQSTFGVINLFVSTKVRTFTENQAGKS